MHIIKQSTNAFKNDLFVIALRRPPKMLISLSLRSWLAIWRSSRTSAASSRPTNQRQRREKVIKESSRYFCFSRGQKIVVEVHFTFCLAMTKIHATFTNLLTRRRLYVHNVCGNRDRLVRNFKCRPLPNQVRWDDQWAKRRGKYFTNPCSPRHGAKDSKKEKKHTGNKLTSFSLSLDSGMWNRN